MTRQEPQILRCQIRLQDGTRRTWDLIKADFLYLVLQDVILVFGEEATERAMSKAVELQREAGAQQSLFKRP